MVYFMKSRRFLKHFLPAIFLEREVVANLSHPHYDINTGDRIELAGCFSIFVGMQIRLLTESRQIKNRDLP